MPSAPRQPGLTTTFTLKGYSVEVTADSEGVHHVTCTDLPQLSVSDGSSNGALALPEEEIGAILAGRERP
jgi:hypothetical protein